jgi:hypothetical protein
MSDANARSPFGCEAADPESAPSYEARARMASRAETTSLGSSALLK